MIEAECTTCGGRFELDDSKAGHRGVCSRCGSEIEIPGDPLMADLTPLELADDDFDDEPQSTVATDDGEPILLNLATDPAKREQTKVAWVGSTTAPVRRFWADAGMSFTLPLKGKGVLVLIFGTFLYCAAVMIGGIVSAIFILALMPVIWYSPFHGLPLLFLGPCVLISAPIMGYLCAYWMRVVQATCGGEDELPAMAFDGWWDGACIPFFQVIGTVLWAAAPLGIWGWLVYCYRPILPGVGDLIVTLSLVVFALFMWPMTFLAVAINGFTFSALRYDLQLLTIGRSFTSYLIICVLLTVPAASTCGILYAMISVSGITGWAALTLVGLLLAVVSTYFSFVAMRIIGLFYRHSKRRFAWEAE